MFGEIADYAILPGKSFIVMEIDREIADILLLGRSTKLVRIQKIFIHIA